ncbi:hypothetical protein BS50DRAFT_578682 [Corynespora cassiicola Philippines]|uniref:CAP-Gly domain-containing protein n=1 Tax=Corynespora cassiicola Philippines TaxID=1448308 RepID=A0A2T2N7A3_CORCC|nr:hypothetical protein BS50DRAFT_578682 [Corynespora cassiicola Philippines]
MAEYRVGQTVETTDRRKGLIKYIGEIHVADGQFIGIELPSATGKNDGSVQGQRYFSCAPAHGLFIRPASITQIIAQPAPSRAAASSPSKPATPRPRPSSIGKTPVKPASAKRTSTAPAAPPKSAASASSARPTSVALTKPAPRRLSQARPASIAQPSPRAATTGARSTSSSTAATSAARASAAKDSTIETLETKIRHLEKQHGEDREQLKSLQQDKADKERFEGIIQKLQSKCQSLHQENGDLRNSMKQLESNVDRLEKTSQSFETDLEIAFLDKEMAEERAEQAEQELEQVRSRLEERELELEILRDEANMLTEDMSEEDRQTANFSRLQHERDRLREALLKLKEITEETEAENRARIRELERDVANIEEVRAERSDFEERLVTADATIEDLRQQLDAANEWEEMIEDLSDQNQQFKERIAEKDLAIKDLESLKELSDELELQHIEHANELRAELEAKDFELADQSQKLVLQEAQIADQEMLITKFRDLVLDLQSKMTDAEASKTMSEEQVKDTTGRFNEVMELNRRLHGATLNTTVKTITAELQKVQAEEAEEELHIVKHYLPESSGVYMNESLRAYFRAKRVSAKANLSKTILLSFEASSRPIEETDRPLNDILRLTCIHHLERVQLRSEQFWSAVPSATLEEFTMFGAADIELIPVEKNLARILESLKKDELHMKEAAESTERSDKILQGIASDFKKLLDVHPENEVMLRGASMHASLEFIKAILDTVMMWLVTSGIAEPDSDNEIFSEKTAKLVSVFGESAAIFAKLVTTLQALREDNLYPQFPSGIDELVEQDESLHQLLQSNQTFIQDFAQIISQQAASDEETDPDAPLHPLKSYLMALETFNVGVLSSKATAWNEHAMVLMHNIEIEQGLAPWVLKAKEMEAAKNQTIEAEKRLQLLTAEHHATIVQIREREEIIETKELEIEHLRAKHREATAKSEDVGRLQSELGIATEELQKLHQVIAAQRAEIQDLKDRPISMEEIENLRGTPTAMERQQTKTPEPTSNTTHSSVNLMTFLQALSNENNWLRRRENSNMLDYHTRAMFAELRTTEHPSIGTDKADELLSLSMAIEESPVSALQIQDGTGWELQDHKAPEFTPESKLPPLTQGSMKMAPASGRQGRPPLLLTPINTRVGMQVSPSFIYEDLEDLSFLDLSPVVEDFTAEMMESMDKFSEIRNSTLDTIDEGFSTESFGAVGEVALNNFLERAIWR